MSVRIPARLAAPLAACVIAGGAAIVGGACIPSTSVNPPALRTGTYVLTSPSGHSLPGTFVDATGSTLRVLADTIIFDVGQQTYEQRARVTITPPGGTEGSPVQRVVARQSFPNGRGSFVLPSTIYGPFVAGNILSDASFQLTLPDGTFWRYDYR